MLLGIFSDTHLGFSGDDRYEESFARFKEALSVFKERKADFILHAGDLFDEAVPEQEVWKRAFECFAQNNNSNNLASLAKESLGGRQQVLVKGTPIIAIHGTHEFRGKDFANAIDVLEEANCLVHIHAGHVVLEKNGEKVFIHGLGGVPEKHAKEVLAKYDPRPVAGGTNILLLHQSFKEFLPFDDDESVASLSLGDLPDGFDLVIDGHLHWPGEQNAGGRRFLLTGSTIFTQMKRLEGEKKKGVFIFDTRSKALDFVEFKNPRKLFYEKLEFKGAQPEEVIRAVQERLAAFCAGPFSMKPLVRIRAAGSLAKGFSQSDVSIDLSPFKDKAILSVSKEFSVEAFHKKIEGLKEVQAGKRSVLEMGLDLLERNVEEAKLEKFDARRMFGLLSVGENEKAEAALIS